MKLYIANGLYVGTQADAKKIDKAFYEIDVPTDKAGLIEFLNTQPQQHADASEIENADDLLGDADDLLAPEPAKPSTGNDVPPRTSPGYDYTLTSVEEFIQQADHRELACCTNQCIWRLQELSK